MSFRTCLKSHKQGRQAVGESTVQYRVEVKRYVRYNTQTWMCYFVILI